LQSENTTQGVGGFISDLAVSGPQAVAARSGNVVRAGANALQRSAVPALTRTGATQVLERGVGYPSAKNAAALAAEAAATPVESSIMVKRGAHWVPRETKPSKLQPAADAMTEAAATPSAKISWPELAMLGGGGYMLGGPKVAAAMGAIRLLNRPGVKATAAKGLQAAGPALQASGAGIATPVVRQILAWLQGGEQ